MKIEEAIETLEEKRKYCKMFYELSANPQEDYPSTAKFMDALELALTVLRSMQEAGEPLSLEQLRRLDELSGTGNGIGRVTVNKLRRIAAQEGFLEG